MADKNHEDVQKQTRIRTHKQLVDDWIFPSGGGFSGEDMDKRLEAVEEVLCRIPEKKYQKLVMMIDDFMWFIPHAWEDGKIYPFTITTEEEGLKPYSQVLYLSPSLERKAFDIVVATVAHELAHLVLKHKIVFVDQDQYNQQEAQAWELVRNWGFVREEKKHEVASKRYYTNQERIKNKLYSELKNRGMFEGEVK
jgi:hypothetical protein